MLILTLVDPVAKTTYPENEMILVANDQFVAFIVYKNPLILEIGKNMDVQPLIINWPFTHIYWDTINYGTLNVFTGVPGSANRLTIEKKTL